ncbi:glycosyltransferase family 2 protein [Actinoplanes sp. NPDC023801]|uniref:glycosyltransferase family 2 protein n=1 Tax=Actinoplanes sp. NPDC023801 TaxID=3154595 RepID=UPI0033EDE6ED
MTVDVETSRIVPRQRSGEPGQVTTRIPLPNRTPRLVAIVPAYNEAATIAGTVRALRRQWAPRLDDIIVVPNNCTDATADLARAAGATVLEFPGVNEHKKAGALNWAVNRLLPGLQDEDQILVTDADSVLDPDFTQHARRALLAPHIRGHRRSHRQRPAVGAVCACFRTEREPSGLLARLQRNEYERFARQIGRSGDNALVLSGVATLFDVSAIRRVIAARGTTLPGYPGEFYHRDTATEDIELTFAFRALGYRPKAPAQARALTDVMPSWKALRDQRLRWQRGMLDSLRLYGWTRATAADVARQLGIYLGSLAAPAYLTFLAVMVALSGRVPFSWSWAPITLLFVVERVWTVRRNRWSDVLLAAVLIPEWAYEQWRSGVYWLAVWKTLRGSEREWINV